MSQESKPEIRLRIYKLIYLFHFGGSKFAYFSKRYFLGQMNLTGKV